MANTIQVLRGLSSNRLNVTPAIGEFLYTTDDKNTYMGDGSTPGGVLLTGTASTISGFDTEVSNNTDVAANTSARHTHANEATLDLIDQDVSADGAPNFDSVQLNGGVSTQGTVSWNTDEETLDLIQNGATLQLGQETQINCRNNTVSIITNGTVVMATGTLGASGRITIAPYDGTSAVKYILGVATADIAVDADGKVTNFGKVREVDTSAWLEGDILYAAAGGALTKVEPTTGVHAELAIVINVHANNGTIMVRFTPIDDNRYEPADDTILKDADIGATIQGYHVDTVVDANYSTDKARLTNTSGTNTGDQDLSGYSLTSHNHSGTYEPADSTILKNADIGVTLQGYDANLVSDASYVHTDNNYTTAEKALVATALQSETTTSLSLTTNMLTYVDEDGVSTNIDLSLYLDDTNLAYLTSGTLNGTTGIATFTRSDATSFDVDMSDLLDDTTVTVNDTLISTSTTEALSANQGKVLKDVQDAQQAAIDLNTAKVSNVEHPLVETAVPVGAVFTDTTYTVQDGGLTENNLTTALKTSYDTAYTHSQAVHAPTNADNTAANETSHADVLVDGDFSTAGFMKTNGAGNYSIDSSSYLTTYTDLTVDGAGTIHANNYTDTQYTAATPGTDGTDGIDGLMSDADKFKLDNIESGSLTKATLDKTFIQNETYSITLSPATAKAIVGVQKEIPQLNETNDSWNLSVSNGFDYEDSAYLTTLTPSAVTGNITLTLGTGSFATSDIGKTVTGNGGKAVITKTDGSAVVLTDFTNTNAILSGDWTLTDIVEETSYLTKSGGAFGNVFTFTDVLYTGESATGFRYTQYGDSGNCIFYRKSATDNTTVYKSDLSTPYDLSTRNNEVSTTITSYTGVYLASNGMHFYCVEIPSIIHQYDLTTAWDISSGVSYNGSKDFSTDMGTSWEVMMAMSSDGTKLFLDNYDSGYTRKYNLNNYSITSAANSANTNHYHSTLSYPGPIFLSDDGDHFYQGTASNRVSHYDLGTSNSLDGTVTANTFYDPAEIGAARSISVSPDGVHVLLGDSSNSYYYTLATAVKPDNSKIVAITNSSGQVDTNFWVDLNSVLISETDVTTDKIHYALSDDSKTTWKVGKTTESFRSIVRNNGGTWEYNSNVTYASTTWTASTANTEYAALEEAMTIDNNKMDKTQVEAILDSEWFALTTTLDYAVIFDNDLYTSPKFNSAQLDYDAQSLWENAIPGTDYTFDQPITSEVRLKALLANNLKVRVI